MMPARMQEYLLDHIPEAAVKNRTIRENGRCYLELNHSDEYLLSRIGINRDRLGPRLVVGMWDEASPEEIGGYLVVDNLAMGTPAMGGIRMLPDVTPADIYNLARGMTLKNAAADLPYGGGKAGIVAEAGASAAQRTETVKRYARLLHRYHHLYVPGPDVGTDDADMKAIAVENGLDRAVSKPADMGGSHIDEMGAAAGGLVIALERLLEILPRLTVLPQFVHVKPPPAEELTVIIQGFGAVGAHTARILGERLPGAKVVGISDLQGYVYNKSGLPVDKLLQLSRHGRLVTHQFFEKEIASQAHRCPSKFSTDADNLLRESAFCFIPAAPVFNYLGTSPADMCAITVEQTGKWSLIIEGANTYSPDPNRKAMRTRMERAVYRRKGVMIASDYLVNSGGVIFAAQEHLIPTPAHLQIPAEMLGNRETVEAWLIQNQAEFEELSARRLEAGTAYRNQSIRRNMTELVDTLAASVELLPCQAAERISLRRLAEKESKRTARDIMEPMPLIDIHAGLHEAAALMVETQSSIIGVLSADDRLAGVLTTWDITQAAAEGAGERSVETIMTRDVIAVNPAAGILDVLNDLEQNRISAMPVVDEGRVLGMVNSDLLAQRYLLRLLRADSHPD